MSKKTIVNCSVSLEIDEDEYEALDIIYKIIGKRTLLTDKIVLRIDDIVGMSSFASKQYKEKSEFEAVGEKETKHYGT